MVGFCWMAFISQWCGKFDRSEAMGNKRVPRKVTVTFQSFEQYKKKPLKALFAVLYYVTNIC